MVQLSLVAKVGRETQGHEHYVCQIEEYWDFKRNNGITIYSTSQVVLLQVLLVAEMQEGEELLNCDTHGFSMVKVNERNHNQYEQYKFWTRYPN